MNKESIAEQYSKEAWGVYYDDKHPDTAINDTVGEISKKDWIAGFDFAINECLKHLKECSDRLPIESASQCKYLNKLNRFIESLEQGNIPTIIE